jgi:hypothetical protein
MAQIKLTPPYQVVVAPGFARARRRHHESPFRSRGEDDAALAKIAQRFAPGGLPLPPDRYAAPAPSAPLPPDRYAAPAPSAPSPRASLPPASLPRGGDAALTPPPGGALGAFRILPTELKGLIAALLFIAVLPSLTIAAMFFLSGARVHAGNLAGLDVWLGGQASAEGEAPHASVTAASLAALPASPRAAPRPAPTASLAAPSALEAKAGQSVPFALALASVAPLPEPSVIAVSGLPRGATFSAGQPYGESEWNLRPDEIGGLRLVLPPAARGEAKLEIVLIAADGTELASAETAVKMSGDAEAIAASGTAPVAAAASPSASTTPQASLTQASSMQAFSTQASSMQGSSTQASSMQAASTQEPSAEPASVQASSAQATLTPAASTSAQASLAQAAPTKAASAQAPSMRAASAQAASTQEASAQAASTQEASAQASSVQASPTQASPIQAAAQMPADAAKTSITLSEFVNFREGPTSSSRVMGVIARGATVTPLERRRGWLKVTDAGSGETGWIYGRYAGGATESSSDETASPLRLGPGSDDSFWTRVGNWFNGS